MVKREVYLARIEKAANTLGSDMNSGKCARLVSAAFLGVVLPARELHLEYLMDEEKAGLRTMQTSSPITSEIATKLLHQDKILVDGIIFDTTTLKDGIGHRVAVLFDNKSRKDGSVVYVDALVNERRYSVLPSINLAFDYMKPNYDLLSAWNHVVIPKNVKLPTPDTRYGLGRPRGTWIVNGITLDGDAR